MTLTFLTQGHIWIFFLERLWARTGLGGLNMQNPTWKGDR